MKQESEKVGLKLNIQKTKIMASGPMTSLIACKRVHCMQTQIPYECRLTEQTHTELCVS